MNRLYNLYKISVKIMYICFWHIIVSDKYLQGRFDIYDTACIYLYYEIEIMFEKIDVNNARQFIFTRRKINMKVSHKHILGFIGGSCFRHKWFIVKHCIYQMLVVMNYIFFKLSISLKILNATVVHSCILFLLYIIL